MPYAPELHEPLTDVQWDAEHAHSALRAIVRENTDGLDTA